jgi:hypothetical protein
MDAKRQIGPAQCTMQKANVGSTRSFVQPEPTTDSGSRHPELRHALMNPSKAMRPSDAVIACDCRNGLASKKRRPSGSPTNRWILVALCGVLIYPLTACSGSAEPSPTRTLAATRVVKLGSNLQVVFTDAPPLGSTITVSTTSPPPTPAGWLSLAKPIHLSLNGGSVTSGATLEFGVAPSLLASNSQIGIATYDETLGRWVPVAATLNPTTHVVEAFTRHFSWWQPWTWDWASIAANVSQDVEQLLGKSAAPATCRGGAPNWVNLIVGLSDAPGVSIRGCAQAQGSVLDVELVNNRPYGQVLTYGAGVKWGWHATSGSGVDIAVDALMDSMMKPNQLYLPPLSQASVGIWELPSGGNAAFHIGPNHATFVGDLLVALAGPALQLIAPEFAHPLLAACGVSLFQDFPPSALSSPGAIFQALLNLVPCVQQALLSGIANGSFDEADGTDLDQLAAELGGLKTATLIGVAVLFYGAEFDFLDLFIDNSIIGTKALGVGFSVLAKSGGVVANPPPSTLPPSHSPPPTPVPTTPPSQPTASPTPTPPTSQGFFIEDSIYGGTWARTDPDNGTWYDSAHRPPNAAYWYPNGLGVAVNCTVQAAPYTAIIYGQAQTWDWWAHVTDGKWVPVVVFSTVWSDGGQNLPMC